MARLVWHHGTHTIEEGNPQSSLEWGCSRDWTVTTAVASDQPSSSAPTRAATTRSHMNESPTANGLHKNGNCHQKKTIQPSTCSSCSSPFGCWDASTKPLITYRSSNEVIWEDMHTMHDEQHTTTISKSMAMPLLQGWHPTLVEKQSRENIGFDRQKIT
jgi:hypothetical protein